MFWEGDSVHSQLLQGKNDTVQEYGIRQFLTSWQQESREKEKGGDRLYPQQSRQSRLTIEYKISRDVLGLTHDICTRMEYSSNYAKYI